MLRKTLFQKMISISMAILLALSSLIPSMAADIVDSSLSREQLETKLTFENLKREKIILEKIQIRY
ncbi:hypothetical protein UF10_06620 [Peptostreptococcus russellii]|uniref:Uncharacterized protein n=2 Tax=Peptostreptococcus russellii TaxID=215200 RepID=A0A2P7PZ56_9FIRM|nr:hypothetical protein UF10_06620 [Peptostreptococcus russellii]